MCTEEWDADDLARVADLFERLSDTRRLRVLVALAEGGEQSVEALADAVGTTPFAVSYHLTALARLGLVTETADPGRPRFQLQSGVRTGDGMLRLGRGVRVAIDSAAN